MKKPRRNTELAIAIILWILALSLLTVVVVQTLEADALIHNQQASAWYVNTFREIGFNTMV